MENKSTAMKNTHLQSFAARTTLIGTICVALLGGIGALQAATTPRLYLPLSVSAAATQPTPTTPPPTPNPGGTSGLYFEQTRRTDSASAAIDPRGGMHAAFVDSVSYSEHPAVTYTFCAGSKTACATSTNWQSVRLSDQVDEVQLALTPSGQPRLLIQTWRSADSTKVFLYGACDANCAQVQSWTLTEAATAWGTAVADVHRTIMPQRFFALDRQGHPRFVYYDRNWFTEPDHLGMFYASCDEECAQTQSWTSTPIGGEQQGANTTFEYPSLTFTSKGQPRVVAHINIHGSDQSGISYIGCDADCTTGENWRHVVLYERGSGFDVGWDIAVDAQDRPRITFFPGTLAEGRGERLYYIWCNSETFATCLDVTQWQGTTLGLPARSGKQPDLVIDPQGRPRIAFLDNGNLGYLSCSAQCEAEQAQWAFKEVETHTAMKQANPKAIPATCNADLWTPLAPVLALDTQGNPHIAYDVLVEAHCQYIDPDDQKPFSRFERIWRGVRWVSF